MSPSAPILNQVLTWPSGCHLKGDSVNKVQKMNPKGVTSDYMKQKQSKIINFTGNGETCPRIHSSKTFLLINFIYYVLRDGFPFARFWIGQFLKLGRMELGNGLFFLYFSYWKLTFHRGDSLAMKFAFLHVTLSSGRSIWQKEIRQKVLALFAELSAVVWFSAFKVSQLHFSGACWKAMRSLMTQMTHVSARNEKNGIGTLVTSDPCSLLIN